MIFYTCIWIPFLQTTQSILRNFTCFIHHPENALLRSQVRELDLRVSRFRDLECKSKNRGDNAENEEVCSICLVVFEEKDSVNKLPRCGHIFHMECMKKWLERCQFSCPLCRSLVSPDTSPSCGMWASASCVQARFLALGS
ncbi:RING-H2 finger protein atl18 [Phtheirospermum japonicum]|uniref:RING-H2 finger protein atl18 n=1 Tax=Phtheirospermum japonicum TaxID=374723 RepID=A0A830BRP7_9LAMI|nr:RING-H2 finger protein atl18 [Phtheirospermum japonicum]